MTALDLPGLRAIAQAATRPPWEYDTLPGHYGQQPRLYGGSPQSLICVVGNAMVAEQDQWENDVRHLQAAHPGTVLALIAEIERLRAALRPFAKIRLMSDIGKVPVDVIEMTSFSVTPTDVHRAREALESTP